MKTIGLIGGTSWVSTVDYYRIINSTVNQRLGGNQSAKVILHSVNYGEIVALTQRGDWDSIASIIGDAAQKAEWAGADCILLGANTMHKIAGEIQERVNIPLLHIADITAKAIHDKGVKEVLLLGTRYTMLGDFYSSRLQLNGLQQVIPEPETIDWINSTIYDEMGKGIFLEETKRRYIEIIDRHIAGGVQGVIFGCTEIPMLLKPEDAAVPVFDTLLLHATAAVDFALG